MLIEKTPILAQQLPLDAFRDHLRMGTGFTDDDLQNSVLFSFLEAAYIAIEARVGVIFLIRDFQWRTRVNWSTGCVTLPAYPLREILNIARSNTTDVQTSVENNDYFVRHHNDRAELVLNVKFPAGTELVIDFSAGQAQDWGQIPADLKQAIFLLAAHYYEFRNELNLSSGCMPFGVTSLIERYRTKRFNGLGVRV